MATTDQEYRTEAAKVDYELKFFVGADRLLGDLSLLEAGQTYDPEASTTLTADFDDADTSIPVTSTSGFTTGFVVIHPASSTEAYEIIAYGSKTSTTFDNLTRLALASEAELGGRFHSSGATVSEWLEVTSYIIGELNINASGGKEITGWSANIKGHNYSSSIFQPDRAILCMWRFRPKDGSFSTWTSWTVGFIGFLQDISIDGDYTEANTWSAKVVGLDFYAAKTKTKGTQYGKTDLAEGKTVEVSSYLKAVYEEQDSGEFIGTPDLDGDQLVDADMATLWISDGEPSRTEETTQNDAGSINEVFLRPNVWMPDHLQWIELHIKSTQGFDPSGFGRCQIAASCTTWKYYSGWDPEGYAPLNNYLQLPDTGFPDIGDDYFCIITSDAAAFRAYFPQANCDIYDWRPMMVGNFVINTDGDFLCGRWFGVNTWDVIWFDNGRASWSLYDFVGGGSHYYALPGTNYSGWSGDMVDLPPVGHSFRRNPTGKQTFVKLDGSGAGTAGVYTDFKEDEDHPTPGYYNTRTPEWLIVDIGETGIELSATLTSGETTQALITANMGLVDGPADVEIDTEIIGYATIDRVNNKLLTLTRGKYSTTPAEHPSGSDVKQYEDGASTYNHLINSIAWRRRSVIGDNGYINVPRFFDIYATIYSAGYPTPGDANWDNGLGLGGWEDYWVRLKSVTYYTPTYFLMTLLEAMRARKVMMAIYGMTDTGRVKLNQFYIYPNQGFREIPSEATTEDEEDIAGWSGPIVSDILQLWMGIPSANIDLQTEGRQIPELTVTKTSVKNVLQDICQRTGTAVVFNLDNTVEYIWDPHYPGGVWPTSMFSWDRSTVRNIRYTRKTKRSVAQVILNIHDSASDESYQAKYPTEPLAVGEVIELDGEMIFSDEGEAVHFAERMFNVENLGDEIVFAPVGIAEFVYPGQRHTVEFDVDEEHTFLAGQNFIITNVSHSIKLGIDKGWDTTITARRIEYA